MLGPLREFLRHVLASGLLPNLFSIAGFLLAVFLVARLMSEKRAPANTLAWLLIIVLVPYVGVPLYLLFGGRKLQRVSRRKSNVLPTLPGSLDVPKATSAGPVPHTVSAAGAGAPVAGNRVTLLTTGEEEFEALERHIRAARDNIHITTFILSRDEVGRRIVSLLAEKAAQGVKVRLLLDALGCPFSSLLFVNPLRRAGGKVGRFMPVLPFVSPRSANLRNHRKIAIFDHRTAIVGGRNLAREYMGPAPFRKRWRDLGGIIEGPAAALLNEVFIADWCFATKDRPDVLHDEIPPEVAQPRGTAELQVVASGPDVAGDPLYEGIVAMIQDAQEDIWIVTPYFIPDDVLLRSLIVKARAGCRVTLVVPAHSNHPIADFARRTYTRELRRAGARILVYSHAMLHAKAVIVDGRTALLGSPNFDLRSMFVNFEIGVLVYSAPEIATIKAWLDGLVAHSHEPRPEPVSARRRLLGNVAEDISRLIAPLL
jgi:cardiolipin synthase A/B